MNRLPRHKQEASIAALIEGLSIRSVERLVGAHRDTIMRMMVRTGEHCQQLLDERLRGIEPGLIQCDEAWTYTVKRTCELTK